MTTTTTTVVEDRVPLLHWQDQTEWDEHFVQPRSFSAATPEERRAWAVQRAARALRNFERLVKNCLDWKALLSFCGSVLNAAKDRKHAGAIATGANASGRELSRVVAGTRWTTTTLFGGRRQ